MYKTLLFMYSKEGGLCPAYGKQHTVWSLGQLRKLASNEDNHRRIFKASGIRILTLFLDKKVSRRREDRRISVIVCSIAK
jgi:hypothetical protein